MLRKRTEMYPSGDMVHFWIFISFIITYSKYSPNITIAKAQSQFHRPHFLLVCMGIRRGGRNKLFDSQC